VTRPLALPALPRAPCRPLRSSLRWLVRSGDRVRARQPVAYCNLDFAPAPGTPRPFQEEMRELQLVLASPAAGTLALRPGFSSHGGWLDLHGHSFEWDGGARVADLDEEDAGGAAAAPGAAPRDLLHYFAVGRRGFEPGEGRGGLLSGWLDRVRAFWPGARAEPPVTLLSLGTCEQLPMLRGEGSAFADWFAVAEGPAHLVLHTDDRVVHSSAVLLEQLRRTPAQARELLAGVQRMLAQLVERGTDDAFSPRSDGPSRRNALAQDLLFLQHAAAETVSPSPLLERLELFGAEGVCLAPPPALVLLSVGSEYAAHLRHRRTGWLLSTHGFRFADLSPAGQAFLHEEFEHVPRSHADVEASLAQLALELRERTGGRLLVANLVSTTMWDRIPNYAWLAPDFERSNPVFTGDCNAMLEGLARRGLCTVLDQDAVVAEQGGRHCPDRIHASGPLPSAYRSELLALLRAAGTHGF